VTLLLVGVGEMGEAYAAALAHHGVADVEALGRGAERVEAFSRRTGLPATPGGTPALAELPAPERAIVAVGPEELAPVTRRLLARGCRSILVEKPGALSSVELRRLAVDAGERGADLFVAFNRRFYPSVDAARVAIAEDGGPLAGGFDFTELADRVLAERGPKGWSDGVLARWGVVNSAHVIDLFFHLAGPPTAWEQRRSGSLPWHPAGAVFAGSGATAAGALFSYRAAWSGAGRWGVEVTTARRRLVLQPLETLTVQQAGSFALERAVLAPEPAGLKPGLAGLVAAFLDGADPRLCRADEAADLLAAAEAIMGYAR
jgi:predicted dehydrogenase